MPITRYNEEVSHGEVWMEPDAKGRWVAFDDLLPLLVKCREMADWHGNDGDECGRIAQEVLSEIDSLTDS